MLVEHLLPRALVPQSALGARVGHSLRVQPAGLPQALPTGQLAVVLALPQRTRGAGSGGRLVEMPFGGRSAPLASACDSSFREPC